MYRSTARWVVVEVRGVARLWRRWRDKLISETPLTPDYDLTECAARAADGCCGGHRQTETKASLADREEMIKLCKVE